MKQKSAIILFVISAAMTALAADKEHGTLVRTANLYVSPGSTSEKLMQVERGRDMVVLEHTNMDSTVWMKVFVTFIQDENRRDVTGWVSSKGLVTTSTPNGDQIIFGEAVDSENQAEQRGGRKGAAQDAMRLYYRLYEYFPSSPLAGEALWRAADIRWQLEKADIRLRPSSREMSPDMRTPMDDQNLRLVMKKFPHTQWADQAAYNLIDNKLCGSWKGETKCPE